MAQLFPNVGVRVLLHLRRYFLLCKCELLNFMHFGFVDVFSTSLCFTDYAWDVEVSSFESAHCEYCIFELAIILIFHTLWPSGFENLIP